LKNRPNVRIRGVSGFFTDGFLRGCRSGEKSAYHRRVGLYPTLGKKTITKALKRDVRLLGARLLQKLTMRRQLGSPMSAVSDRFVLSIEFQTLQPFDGNGLANPKPSRRRLVPSISTASMTRSPNSCE
jgi:hypothetical protein